MTKHDPGYAKRVVIARREREAREREAERRAAVGEAAAEPETDADALAQEAWGPDEDEAEA